MLCKLTHKKYMFSLQVSESQASHNWSGAVQCVFWVTLKRSAPNAYRLFTGGDLHSCADNFPERFRCILKISPHGLLQAIHGKNRFQVLFNLEHSDMINRSSFYWSIRKSWHATCFLMISSGPAWMRLSRPFMEFCLWGWDNLPRIVLMYYTNFLSSP